MGQLSTKQPSSMLISIPLVVISTVGVISFLGTSFIFSSIASSLSTSLSGSVPERIFPYSYPQHQHLHQPNRHQQQHPALGHPSYPSSGQRLYRTLAQSLHSRTKRSSEMLLFNILNKMVSSQLCLRQINFSVTNVTLGLPR